jgi:hypothetical protein
VHIGPVDDDALVGSLPIWKHEWRATGESMKLPPESEAATTFPIYEAGGVGWPVQVRFAAEEISPGVWSFWELT